MGKILDTLKTNKTTNYYEYNNYIHNNTQMTNQPNNQSTISYNNINASAFIGYTGQCKMYAIHKWCGNK